MAAAPLTAPTSAREAARVARVPVLWDRWEALAPRFARGTLLACFDYDGTLVPIQPTPEEAVADDETRAALRALAASAGTVVTVVSGRPVAQLRALLECDALWLIGLHGLELAAPGEELPAIADVEALAAALSPLRTVAAELAQRYPGVRVEDKGTSLALHTRQAAREDARAAAAAYRAAARPVPGFHLLAGKEVLELRPDGVDKGVAVRRLQRHAGSETTLYVGDDTTDEDAFAALATGPGAAATGVTVRVAEGDLGAPTRAAFVLQRQAEVPELLRRLVALRA